MNSPWHDLPVRAVTLIVGVPTAIVLVLAAPPWLFAVTVALIAGMATGEYLRLVDRAGEVVSVATVAVAMVLPPVALLTVDAVSARLAWLVPAGATLLVALTGLQRQWWGGNPTKLTGVLCSPVFALSYGGLLTALVVLLRGAHGPGWVVFALAIAWGGDIGGYLVGRSLGEGPRGWGRLVAPRLSQRKTVVGALGGLVAATFAALVVRYLLLTEEPFTPVVVLALVGSVAAQSGDLFESSIKRRAGVSDSGSIILGNGGLLDMIDGLLFVTPWFLVALPLIR